MYDDQPLLLTNLLKHLTNDSESKRVQHLTNCLNTRNLNSVKLSVLFEKKFFTNKVPKLSTTVVSNAKSLFNVYLS